MTTRITLVANELRPADDLPITPELADDNDHAFENLVEFAKTGRGHWRRRWYATRRRP